MTLEDTPNAIGSPGLEAGPTPSNSPDGQPIGRPGRGAVPVSRFRAQESGKAMPTNDICGPLFNASSPSASLQWSLESRLRQRMEGNGCPLYALTWSTWDMPAGPQICRQRASARRTSGNGCSGWPTPKTKDSGQTPDNYMEKGGFFDLQVAAKLAGWPSPLANKLSPQQLADFTPNLANVAQMAGWPTPIQNDGANRTQHVDGQDGKLSIVVLLTAPSEASATNAGTKSDAATSAALPLDVAAEAAANTPTNAPDSPGNVLLTGWRTPRVTDGTPPRKDWKKTETLGFMQLRDQALTTGETSNGLPAQTERRGQLNPEFTRWLMGYPEEWASCAPTATR